MDDQVLSKEPEIESADALSLPEEDQIKLLNDLIVNCRELEQVEQLARHFNVLRVLGVHQGELRHSNLLAWLLSPDEAHGFGERFLRRWLVKVIYEAGADYSRVPQVVQFASQLFKSVTVTREWSGIDILVEIRLHDDRTWIIGIENKVRAKQSDKQLERYRKLIDEGFAKAEFRVLIFLTIAGEGSEDSEGDWLVAFHSQIESVLAELLNERKSTIGEGPRELIQNYLEVLREDFMEKPRSAELARQIYAMHRKALDIIFEHRPDADAILTKTFEDMFSSEAKNLGIIMRVSNKGVIRFMPNEWATPANLRGEAWGKTDSAFVLCELRMTTGPVRLLVVQSKSPKVWRDILWKDCREKKLKRIKATTADCGEWAVLFSVKNASLVRKSGDEGQTDPQFAEACLKWVKKVLAENDFKTASSLIKSHLDKLESHLGPKPLIDS